MECKTKTQTGSAQRKWQSVCHTGTAGFLLFLIATFDFELCRQISPNRFEVKKIVPFEARESV